MLKKMSIFYMNIRDLKSKETSFHTIIEETKPSIIAITETWMSEEDSIEINGYDTIYRNDRDDGKGGGILIAIHNNLKHVVCETAKTKEEYESIWMVLNNGRVNMKIGVVYFPQEKDVTMTEAENIYSKISEEVKEGRNCGQSIIVVGDFNCKVGNKIKGNKVETTTGGKMLIKLLKEDKLSMINGSEVCKGIWTRTEKNKKSILDYVIVSKENEDIIKEMVIDEEKELAPFRIKDVKGIDTTVYSDHNVILLNLNLIEPERLKAKSSKMMIITAKGYAQIRKEFEEERISNIWKEQIPLSEKYTKWSTKVKEIEEKHKKEIKRKIFTSKKVRVMRRLHKQLKKKRKESDEDRRQEIVQEIKELRVLVIEAEEEERHRKIVKVVESIAANGKMNGGAFWEFRKKFTRKKEQPHAMMNADGKKVFKHDEIKKVYQDFYEDLLNNKEQHENSVNYENISTEFEGIMRRAENQPPLVVSRATVAATFKKLKRKKAKDDKGWNNEIMKEGGDEMEKSVELMINGILSEEIIPNEWNSMLIRSNHKKGEKMMKNKRGLFLTNVVSKVFEKAVEIEMGVLTFDQFQAGGTKERSPIDNWIIVMAMRD